MADKKISALTSATTPLDGTEVLPIVQSGATVKVANNDLRPKQIQSNATSGVLQIAGPAAASTRVMTTPDANFTVARTDAAQTFAGTQTMSAYGTGLAAFSSAGVISSTTSPDIGTASGTSLDLGGTGLTSALNARKDSLTIAAMGVENEAATGAMVRFYTNGQAVVGSISFTAAGVTYNVTSDYRLKNNQQPLTDSGQFIDALKPKTWDWANSTLKGVGFIAHEFAEVSPSSVSGAKDEVDENGKPVYQSMQAGTSEVIANLVAEIQSLRKRLAAAGL
jgi:hypothetical protein